MSDEPRSWARGRDDFLVDIYAGGIGGALIGVPEQPQLNCPCAGTGWLGREWMEKRPSVCTCDEQTVNFDTVLHRVDCDAVPCPFHEESREA